LDRSHCKVGHEPEGHFDTPQTNRAEALTAPFSHTTGAIMTGVLLMSPAAASTRTVSLQPDCPAVLRAASGLRT